MRHTLPSPPAVPPVTLPPAEEEEEEEDVDVVDCGCSTRCLERGGRGEKGGDYKYVMEQAATEGLCCKIQNHVQSCHVMSCHVKSFCAINSKGREGGKAEEKKRKSRMEGQRRKKRIVQNREE